MNTSEVDQAVENVDVAASRMEEAKKQLRDKVREFLLSSESQKEMYARVAHIYWNLPEFPTNEISACLGIGHFSELRKLLPPGPRTNCIVCGTVVAFSSRTELQEYNKKLGPKSRHASPREIICGPCRMIEETRKTEEWRKEERSNLLRFAALQAMPYKEYLLSPEWQAIRANKLHSSRYRCQLCNSTGLLNVHHRTYERPRGREYLYDLIVLCRPCHAKFHGKPVDGVSSPVLPNKFSSLRSNEPSL